jgi:hypothetical protein
MGDVQTTFTANDQDVLKAYERLKRMNLDLIAQQGKVKQAHDESGNAMKEWSADQIKDIGKTLTALFSVEKAVEAVTAAYEDWRDKMRDVAAESRSSSETALRAIGAIGGATYAAEITEFVTRAAKPEAASALLQGIREGNPALAVPKAIEIAKHYHAGDAADTGAEGRAMGAISRAAPSMVPEQLASAAAYLRNKVGARAASEITSPESMRAIDDLVKSGAEKDFSAAMGLAMWGAPTLGGRFMEKIANAIARPRPSGLISRAEMFEPVKRAERRFLMAGDAAEKMHLIWTDPMVREAVLGKEAIAAAGGDQSRSLADEFRENMLRGRYAQQEADQISQVPKLAGAETSALVEGLGKNADEHYADAEEQRANMLKMIEAIKGVRNEGWFHRGLQKWQSTEVDAPEELAVVEFGALTPAEIGLLYAGSPDRFLHRPTVAKDGLIEGMARDPIARSREAFPEAWRGLPGGGDGLRSTELLRALLKRATKEFPSQQEDLQKLRHLAGPENPWEALEGEYPDRADEFEATRRMIGTVDKNWRSLQKTPGEHGPRPNPWQAIESLHPDDAARFEQTRRLLEAHTAALKANTDATQANTAATTPAGRRVAPTPALANKEGR